jgi:hypothetical protein
MSDAFQRSWEVAKMPYHGTTSDRVESIMREGLKPGTYEDSNKFIGGKDGYKSGPKVFASSYPTIANLYGMMAANMPQRKRAHEQGLHLLRDPNLSVPYIQDDVATPAIIRIDPSFPMRQGYDGRGSPHLFSNVAIPPEFLELVHESDFEVKEPTNWPAFERGHLDSLANADLPVDRPKRKLSWFDDDPDETGYSPELSLEEMQRRVKQ